MGRISSIDRLTPEVRKHIERRLAEARMTLDELIADLRKTFPSEAEQGELPSRSAMGRYGQKLTKKLEAIRASTEAARLIQETVGDRTDARSEALTALVQSELFDAIMAIQEADDSTLPPEDRVGVLSSAAKNIATLTRSSVNLKEFQAKAEERGRKAALEEQKAKLAQLGKTGAISQEALAAVIKAAYDL